MKKITLIIALFVLIGTMAAAQNKPTTTPEKKPVNLTVNKSGEIVSKTAKSTVKAADPVYKVVDGITVYQGAKGGLYYYKTSKKTGEQYKCYLPKTK